MTRVCPGVARGYCCCCYCCYVVVKRERLFMRVFLLRKLPRSMGTKTEANAVGIWLCHHNGVVLRVRECVRDPVTAGCLSLPGEVTMSYSEHDHFNLPHIVKTHKWYVKPVLTNNLLKMSRLTRTYTLLACMYVVDDTADNSPMACHNMLMLLSTNPYT